MGTRRTRATFANTASTGQTPAHQRADELIGATRYVSQRSKRSMTGPFGRALLGMIVAVGQVHVGALFASTMLHARQAPVAYLVALAACGAGVIVCLWFTGLALTKMLTISDERKLVAPPRK